MERKRTTLDERDYDGWLRALFPAYLSRPDGTAVAFAAHQHELWRWVWALQRGDRPAPFVAVWPRGGAKSTSAELSTVVAAARSTRRYGLYVCETQTQADDHVGNVGAMLESSRFSQHYPASSERSLGKYGNSKGWRRNRLRTASGFTLDALGLDKAMRGAKVDEDRPDFIIFDDLDDVHDTITTVEKKIAALTKKIIPARSADCAILAVQNVVHPDGIFARLAGVSTHQADFLTDRIVSGPHPAVLGLQYEAYEEDHRKKWRITGGEPTWEGQDLDDCQVQINEMGISAFLSECQHEVEGNRPGTLVFPMFSVEKHVTTGHPVKWEEAKWRVVGVDPGGTDPTAIVPIAVFQRPGSGELFFHQPWEFYRKDGASTEDVIAYLAKIDGQGRIDAVMVDTAGGELALNSIKGYGFKAYPAIKTRSALTSVLRPLYESQRLTIYEGCKNSIREHWGYRVKPSTDPIDGSKYDTDTPVDHHGDAMDARRYAIVAVFRGMLSEHRDVKVRYG